MKCRKLISFYQLDVSVGWKATMEVSKDDKDGEGKPTTVSASGKINMPYISDENDIDEFEIQVTLDSESSATRQQKDLKDTVYKNVPNKLRPAIVTFLTELKAGANVAEKYKDWEDQMKKMEAENAANQLASAAQPNSTSFNDAKKTIEDDKKKLENGKLYATVKLTEKLRGPVPMIYDSFLDSQRLSMMTRAQATVEKKVGGKISMFGNSVVGKIVELEENKKIVQDWRFSDWQESHFSKLTLSFEQQGDMTVVKLTHEKIPSQQEKRVEGGWVNIFNGMKMMLGQVISAGF